VYPWPMPMTLHTHIYYNIQKVNSNNKSLQFTWSQSYWYRELTSPTVNSNQRSI